MTGTRRTASAIAERGVAAPAVAVADKSPERPMPPPRVVVEGVKPGIDGGRFPVKRVVDDRLVVSADVFAEGHDALVALLRFRKRGAPQWTEVPMKALGNDRWSAGFALPELGFYEYAVLGCVDHFATWRSGLEKKVAADQDVHSELIQGAAMLSEVAAGGGSDAALLREGAKFIGGNAPVAERVEAALEPELAATMRQHLDRSRATVSAPALQVEVERRRAQFGAWYEMFPRSAGSEPGRHGTLRDVIARLPYVASLGFDVLYLTPIHPIGVTHRKGPNNSVSASADDVGSPWAIGSLDGGHDAIHPQLGTFDDFDLLVHEARKQGLEIALDLALQCSPDHPYTREHPAWFRHRPDGTIQYAENPPKKYQDIYPLFFESTDWSALWQEMKRVVLFWIGHGVEIFRVDNPHTKPFAFWEWLIREVRAQHPTVIFLSEAFTRPKVMRHLAKSGFSQSYTYFTWRNTRKELTDYFTELTQTEVAEYLRPNLFANTPDILHEYLQAGGRAAHQIRFVLAATLAGNYGIYGPTFELFDAGAVPGTEEYLDSEKYQVRHWDLERDDSLAPFITRVNAIRRANPAFAHPGLQFLEIDNEELVAYARSTPDQSDLLIVVVNLNPHHAHSGWLTLPLADFELDADTPFQVHDLVSDARYLWHGPRNFISLDPASVPAHIFRVRRRLKTERDFDYYL